jgi:hypothetical protein
VSVSSRKSLSGRAKVGAGTGCLRLFSLPFLLIGLGIFYAVTVVPAMQVLAARGWQQTPCVVESSRVVPHSGGKGTTYSIEVVYRYFCAGREYTSKRYHFTVGSTGGRKAKASVVARYPAGLETFCYVNPAVPQEAVIDRGLQPEMAFGGIGLILALAGGFILVFAGRLPGGKKAFTGDAAKIEAGSGGPVTLKPQQTPLTKFFTVLAFATFWNGFISIFVYLVFFSADAKTVPFFAKALVSLFALIGVALIVGVLGDFLALFNPRIHLIAQTTTVSLGGELQFSWKVSGRAGMLRKLRVVFEGREEVTYRRGTNTSTDTKVFATIPVFETTEREFLVQGSARVAVPANLMHTFEAGHNKVLWRLKVQGEIPRWPDVKDEYPITVLPQPRRA